MISVHSARSRHDVSTFSTHSIVMMSVHSERSLSSWCQYIQQEVCRHDVSTFSTHSVVMMSVHSERSLSSWCQYIQQSLSSWCRYIQQAVNFSRTQARITVSVSHYVTMPPWRNPLHSDKLFHLYIQSAFTCSLCHLLFGCMTGSRVGSVSYRNTNPRFLAVTLQRPMKLYSHGNNIVALAELCKTHKRSRSLKQRYVTCNERIQLRAVIQTVSKLKPLKTNFNLNYKRLSPYRAVNTPRLGYKNQSVNVV